MKATWLFLVLTSGALAKPLASVPPYGLDQRPDVKEFYDGKFPERLDGNLEGALPEKISDIGAFTDNVNLTPSNKLVPYGVNSPLWSDAADKKRWMAVPTGQCIVYSPTNEWKFPKGTVFVKHFDLVVDYRATPKKVRRLETRFLIVTDDERKVYGVTYRWDEDLKEARLVKNADGEDLPLTITEADGSTRRQTWHFPSRAECLRCHTPVSGGVLGVNSRQLNGEFTYPGDKKDNQLRTLLYLKLLKKADGQAPFGEGDIRGLPRLSSWNDERATMTERVRSYLDANCSHCHRPGGEGADYIDFDARYDTQFKTQKLVTEDDNRNALVSGDTNKSRIFRSDSAQTGTRRPVPMPPLARNQVDRDWVSFLGNWINYSFNPIRALPSGDLGSVTIIFNDAPEALSGTNAANYKLEGFTLSDPVLHDPGMFVQFKVTPQLAPGTDYKIVVNDVKDRNNPQNTVWPDSAVRFKTPGLPPAPPANDNQGAAFALFGMNAVGFGFNCSASKEPGEPSHAGNDGGNSVWWSWVADTGGNVTVDTAGSSFDTLLAAYTVDPEGRLVLVAENDDDGVSTSRIHFEAIADQRYLFAVDGYRGACGQIMLHVNPELPAVNDNFANASLLSGSIATGFGNNCAATREQDETSHGRQPPTRSLWWSWTAPQTGDTQISTAGSAIDTTLAAYTGDTLEALLTVAESDGEFGMVASIRFFAMAGLTYHFAVDGKAGACGDVALNLHQDAFMPPPMALFNDSFVNALPLEGTNIFNWGNNNCAATSEPGEPNHAGQPPARSLWWSWLAPESADIEVSTFGSSFDTTLAVYIGNRLDSLVLVAENDDDFVVQSTARFPATAGLTYYFAIDGKAGQCGDAVLSLHPVALTAPPPPTASFNDSFLNALPLNGTDIFTFGSNNCLATSEPGEPNHAGQPPAHSLWWSWTAPETADTEVNTFGSSFDTTLAAYTGNNIATLLLVAENDDDFVPRSTIHFPATGGVTYYFAVDGKRGDCGDVVLSVHQGPFTVPPPSPSPAPLNDLFSNAFSLIGTDTGNIFGNNCLASKEPGEPNHSGEPGGSSVWWSWTAPVSTSVTVTASSSDFQPALGMYTGSSANALSAVSPASAGSAPGRYIFFATAGQTYYFAVDGAGGRCGSFTLSVSSEPVATLPLVMTVLGWRLDGFTIQINGHPGDDIVIQASSDLIQWTPIYEAQTTGAGVIFTDPQATQMSQRFYRASVKEPTLQPQPPTF